MLATNVLILKIVDNARQKASSLYNVQWRIIEAAARLLNIWLINRMLKCFIVLIVRKEPFILKLCKTSKSHYCI